MISNACATMRTVKSFLPLLRPFIIKLQFVGNGYTRFDGRSTENAPVDQSLNNGHLGLLELLLGVTTGGVGEVDSMTDLDVVREGDVVDGHTDRTEV